MHRTLQIAVQSDKSDELARRLTDFEGVIGVSVSRGSSVKPPGDVVTVFALNRAADDVLKTVREVCGETQFVIGTSELASLIAPEEYKTIVKDVDEAIWEEMGTGLRHQGRVTPNYIALMVYGGAIAAVGLISEPVPQAIAFIAASIIAPGFEPLVKLPLGITLLRWESIKIGLFSTAVGYSALIASAALTFLVLDWAEAVTAGELLGNSAIQDLTELKLKNLVLPAFGAAAGVVMVAAYRRSVIAGPLIALATIPAAALAGASAAIGEIGIAQAALLRAGIDAALIIVIGVVVFLLKQQLVHKRKPLV